MVLDYESVRTRALGYSIAKAVPIEEVYVPKELSLPMKAAADDSLREFSEISLERVNALDVPFSSVPSTPSDRKRSEYITLERIIRFGATPGCRACSFDTTTHSPVCRARFNGLIKAERLAKEPKASPKPEVAPEVLFPPSPAEDPAPAEASAAAERSEESGIPPPSEDAMVARIHESIDEEFLERHTAMTRSRRLGGLEGRDTLFEYACSDDSTLSHAALNLGVNAVRLSESVLDLANPDHVDQVLAQMLPGCDVWVSIPCTHFSAWQHMSIHRHGRAYEEKLEARRQHTREMLRLAMRVLSRPLAMVVGLLLSGREKLVCGTCPSGNSSKPSTALEGFGLTGVC